MFMRSLTIKLILASLCSSLISLALVGLFAGYQTGVAFDRFVQDRRAGAAVQHAAAYYAQHGSWDGLDVALHTSGGRPPNLSSNRPPRAQPPAGPLPYIVVN